MAKKVIKAKTLVRFDDAAPASVPQEVSSALEQVDEAIEQIEEAAARLEESEAPAEPEPAKKLRDPKWLKAEHKVRFHDPDEAEIARSMYDPENGVCVCKYDLSSVVQDGRYFCMVYMMLKESADTEKYNQPFQDAMAELKALGVQNLSAFIRQEQSEAAARRQVYRVDYMLGTTVPVGELQKDDNYSVLGDMRERVIAKYKSKKQ